MTLPQYLELFLCGFYVNDTFAPWNTIKLHTVWGIIFSLCFTRAQFMQMFEFVVQYEKNTGTQTNNREGYDAIIHNIIPDHHNKPSSFLQSFFTATVQPFSIFHVLRVQSTKVNTRNGSARYKKSLIKIKKSERQSANTKTN